MHPDPQTLIDAATMTPWADLPPARRRLIASAGLAAGGLRVGCHRSRAQRQRREHHRTRATRLPRHRSASARAQPEGQATASEPTPRPASVRPAHAAHRPRAYTAIKSYHAHIYFDEDSFEKAALLRRWAAERFPGSWAAGTLSHAGRTSPRRSISASPTTCCRCWCPGCELNSLGLTILIHPNTGDGRADHLHYALWVNRAQPVNA